MSVNKIQRNFMPSSTVCIGRASENPLQKSDSDEQLAEEFAEILDGQDKRKSGML